MTPATPVLLHGPGRAASGWDAVAAELLRRGRSPLAPAIGDDDRPPYAARYVARASLEIAAAAPDTPLLLVAAAGAGPLLPPIAAAQRAARRPVAGYALVDALLPQPGGTDRAGLVAAQVPAGLPEEDGTAARPAAGGLAVAGAAAPRPPDFYTEALPPAPDWPDAPCRYLLTDPRFAACARLAGLRGWPVSDLVRTGGDPVALVDALLAE
ncbi:hypothetical protein CLV63_112203 [Murinocardiopsis flavida]|uniref:Alpha/beta hydrolase family protein n=1 Tax=Murinocardiopsis flavida TaxID=645275 RepID=A0A2P8DGJ3_9ACTN|nr:hypothetical protein [Murinocardiopsis flavida]PSK96318.1 hypothetical protein CLV63_112203 [Murinocardiopsis flavida]